MNIQIGQGEKFSLALCLGVIKITIMRLEIELGTLPPEWYPPHLRVEDIGQ
jgi:hypothetical protein